MTVEDKGSILPQDPEEQAQFVRAVALTLIVLLVGVPLWVLFRGVLGLSLFTTFAIMTPLVALGAYLSLGRSAAAPESARSDMFPTRS
jgi:hypothetical protein